MSIKVLIADDHALLREGLRRILEMESDLTVVGEACDGKDVVEKAAQLQPDVILMDVNMPGGGGLEATRVIHDRFPTINVVVLTIHDDDEYVVEMVNAGAKGYMLKDVEPARVIDAIHRVHEGEAFIPSDLMAKVFREFRRMAVYGRKAPTSPAGTVGTVGTGISGAAGMAGTTSPADANKLTSRELEVLQTIVDGQTNKEIAGKLFISEKTVKNHVTSILRKLDLTDRTQAAVYALRHDLAKVE